VGIAGLCIWMAAASAQRARRQIEERMQNVAQYLSEERRYPLSQSILLQVKRLSGADYLLVPQSGEPLGTLETPPERLPVVEEVPAGWQTLRLGEPVRAGGETFLCSGFRLHRGPNAGDTLYIFYPESLWRDALWQAVWPFLVLGVSVGLASLALAVAVGHRLSQRFLDLERRTRLIAAGDFSPMPLPRRDDEIRDLTRSVNEMAEHLTRLQETVKNTERLRLLGQVSGGLAHQLRNGLTGARLAVQLYLRESAANTDAAALEVALRQLTLLETSVKRLLDLGRTDVGQRQPCALGDLVGETVQLLEPQCHHAGITLTWQPEADGIVLGDAGQLGQLLLNVMGNAVEAAGPGGRVEVRLSRQKEPPPGHADPRAATEWAVVEVLDSGAGPETAVAERLFEPFVTSKREGVGLGLAVARQVAQVHGGWIGWERQDRMTCFRILLPCAGELASRSDGN
jgi:signal transduction histidine kinase